MVRRSPRQWEVLQAVQNGKVWEHYPVSFPNGIRTEVYSDMDMGPQSHPRFKTVTAAIRVLDKNGLVEISKETARFKEARKWIMTPDGEAVLFTHKT